MSRSFLWIGLVIVIGMMAGFILSRPYIYRGSEINPPVPAADFTLTHGAAGQYRLSDQKGKVILIFFGYTTCPDICPATLSEMKRINSRLGKLSDKTDFVFITVDPQRDTAERISNYAQNFDPSFIGLTGSESELELVWKNYAVYREKSEQDSAAGYLVDHSTRTYLVDVDGNLRLTYPFGTPVDDILQDVRHLLQ